MLTINLRSVFEVGDRVVEGGGGGVGGSGDGEGGGRYCVFVISFLWFVYLFGGLCVLLYV